MGQNQSILDLNNILKNRCGGYSELGQDQFVLKLTNQLKNGFFVEIGLMGGRELSNTYLLEKEFGWQGIVVEPNIRYHTEINYNRSCKIDHRAVTGCSGDRVIFKDVLVHPGLSGIPQYFQPDSHYNTRKNDVGEEFMVDTVSMHDLLIQHNAPQHINYVSIDVEGAEMEIMNNFNWTPWNIDIITVEHNYTEDARHGMRKILASQGYDRVDFSELTLYEDWFFKPHLLKNI